MNYRDILLILLAFIFPPAPVIIKKGCGGEVVVNIMCWCIFILFAIMHAMYIVITNPYENPVDIQHYTSYNVPTQSVYTDIPQDDAPPYEKIEASIVLKAESEVEIKEVATKEPNAEPKEKQITEQKE